MKCKNSVTKKRAERFGLRSDAARVLQRLEGRDLEAVFRAQQQRGLRRGVRPGRQRGAERAHDPSRRLQSDPLQTEPEDPALQVRPQTVILSSLGSALPLAPRSTIRRCRVSYPTSRTSFSAAPQPPTASPETTLTSTNFERLQLASYVHPLPFLHSSPLDSP
jgi:hypothetical protein